MKIIGRNSEIAQLEQYVASDHAEFVALYGRRRVGKTYLVNQLFRGRMAFCLTGVIEGSFADQMAALTDAFDMFGFSIDKPVDSWMKSFSMLRRALMQRMVVDEPCIVFLDEIPCLDTAGSGFAKALGYFWNSWGAQQDNLKLIVCGSATSWMIGNLIDSRGGLHNRITHEMKLQPFTLGETEQYFQAKGFCWSRNIILQSYMMTGGVAYYLSLMEPSESLAQNIDRLYFSEQGPLRREYLRLFKTLFNANEPYLRIVEVLADNRRGMTRDEIITALGSAKGGTLSEQLMNLQECGLVRKYMIREKNVIKNKGAIFQLVDLFCIFHLTFRGKAMGDENYWTNHLGTPLMNTWLGLSFERVCLLHARQIKEALRIDAISTQQYSWRSRNSTPATQIDLIIDRADGMINLCELKYSEQDYQLQQSELDRIRYRCQAFAAETSTRKGIFPTLITAAPLRKNACSEDIPIKITAEDLFR